MTETVMTDPTHMLDTLDEIYANASRLVEGVGEAQWTADTPCTEWTVRALVNHMAGTSKVLGAAAVGATPDGDPNDEHLGDDPLSAFRTAADFATQAWRSDGALDGQVTVPVEMPALAALGVNIIDIGTHCWDLAEATGQAHGLTDETVAFIDFWNRQVISEQIRASGGFGQELDPTQATAMSTMLAFVGREG